MAPLEAHAIAAADASTFKPWTFERREPGPKDVVINILFCGVCHSDLHFVRGEWRPITYPQAPGHEMVGTVASVGSEVTKYKVGDKAAVGCLVDSCQACSECDANLEQFCPKSCQTYGGVEKETGKTTQGGYSDVIVVDEHFVLKVPDGLDLAATAPLLCAGITTFSPLHHWKAGPGKRVGVVGLGGLGHMAVKFAAAMGCDEVVLFTTSAGKAEDAKRLGATKVVISKDEEQMKAQLNTLDIIIDSVSAPHDIGILTSILKRDGQLVLLGAPSTPHENFSVWPLIMGRRNIAGSLIGGIKETQEMLDFCGKHGVVSDIELIRADQIEAAYERLVKGDVKYRFVIDNSTIPK